MVFELKEYRQRMDGAVSALRNEFSGLRTGRANAALLDGIMVEAYGQMTPINQVASVSVPESRMLLVSVWDKSQVASVERALRQSNLGINPVIDGQTMRIPMPPLTMETVKKLGKNGEMSEDELKAHEADIQKATDSVINTIDENVKIKSEEIMQV